jgi:hypothetical protein
MSKTKRIKSEKLNVETVLVDPPSGWMYGFPKEMPVDTVDVNEWLVQNGYPKKQIVLLGDHFHVRFMEKDKEV